MASAEPDRMTRNIGNVLSHTRDGCSMLGRARLGILVRMGPESGSGAGTYVVIGTDGGGGGCDAVDDVESEADERSACERESLDR